MSFLKWHPCRFALSIGDKLDCSSVDRHLFCCSYSADYSLWHMFMSNNHIGSQFFISTFFCLCRLEKRNGAALSCLYSSLVCIRILTEKLTEVSSYQYIQTVGFKLHICVQLYHSMCVFIHFSASHACGSCNRSLHF